MKQKRCRRCEHFIGCIKLSKNPNTPENYDEECDKYRPY